MRRLGVPIYLDEGDQVGLNQQPFWYGGMLYVFNMGRNQFRAQLNVGAEDPAAYKRFDEAAARLETSGGGVISIYYHPTEFVTTEFWDGVNFSKGANPERNAWGKPRRRTEAESERTYGVLRRFVQHMKQRPGVRFVTAQDLLGIYEGPVAGRVDKSAAAAQLNRGIVFGEAGSPAEMLMALLDVAPQVVDGPVARGQDDVRQADDSRRCIPHGVAGCRSLHHARFQRLPNEVFIGSTLDPSSLDGFSRRRSTEQLRESPGTCPVSATARTGVQTVYFATDGKRSYKLGHSPRGFRRVAAAGSAASGLDAEAGGQNLVAQGVSVPGSALDPRAPRVEA